MDGIIKEVILENFMSYKYARVPLKDGVNLIMGPNGSGKSTILLAISVALGQTYTERGRKLSDLIRRGENFARVTVVVNNRPMGGKRPLPWFKSDDVFFSRYIRGDGQYWHEVNGKTIAKAQVRAYLKKIGLDPDNMLIVMHQNMVEEFAFLSPQQKLLLVEEAVGLGQYRLRISEAMRELEMALSEEEKASEMLEKADQTMKYWEEMYLKFRRKKELESRAQLLKAELAWAQVRDRELRLKEIEEDIQSLEREISETESSIRKFLEKEDSLKGEIDRVEEEILRGKEIERGLGELRRRWMEYSSVLAERKVLEFKLQLLNQGKTDLTKELKKAERRVREALEKASNLGERIDTTRSVQEIEEDIREVEIAIAALGRIPPRVEEAYERYKEIYSQLRERAEQAIENRRRLSEELERRKEIWRDKVREVIEKVNGLYTKFLSRLGGTGEIKLVNMDDLENAGLEIHSDFTGLGLVPLDPYRHSGGERSVTVMCFFLALQNYIKSPFRAVDEFDIHMDPKNREDILQMIFELAGEGSQYVIITPTPPARIPENANIIVVQKVRGVSAAEGVLS